MCDPIYINLVYEDTLSSSILQKIIKETKRPYIIGKGYSQGGYGFIKRTINGFNNAAKGMPYLILTDLDREKCAPYLIEKWLTFPKHHNLLFRIAVKEVESWLLADTDNLSKFLGIPRKLIPLLVENINDPKQHMINLAMRSRKRVILEDIVPPDGSTATQGRGYNSRLIEYVNNYWNIKNALKNSNSLQRTFNALKVFQPI